MTAFEFDQEKSKSNKEKHGIDFTRAKVLWDDPWRVIIPTRCTDEKIWLMVAEIESSCWTVIYTIRNERIRIISVRKAREDEKAIYHGGRA